MPQLKGSIERPEPTCYTIKEAQFGIDFELSDTTQIFAPYSFLSHVRMSSEAEVIFYYTYGLITVKGRHLRKVYALVMQQNLGMLRRSKPDDCSSGEIAIKDITFEDAPLLSPDEN